MIGLKWRRPRSKMPFFPMALSCVLFEMRSVRGRCMKSFATMAIGRSMQRVFIDAEIMLISVCCSSKLGEENRRIKAARSSGLDLPPRPPSRAVSDDDDSVVREPTKSHQICSSCRTRDSSVWWKAPKAVHPNGVLCDNCGISWRKYGELNARPMREEPVQKPAKPADKREGTPLNAPNVKRQRVSRFLML